MKMQLKTLAYIVISLLYLVSIALWISIPDEAFLASVVTAISLVLTIALIIWDRERLQTYYLSTQFKKLSSTLMTGGLVLIIVSFLNYFGYKHPLHVDVSIFKKHTLADLSIKTARSVEKPVEVIALAKKGVLPLIKKMMDLYIFENKLINVTYYDEDIRPDLVAKYNVTKSGTLVFLQGEKVKIVSTLNELHVTNALIQLNRTEVPVIAFSKGHGEADLSAQGNEGYSFLNDLLQNSNYKLQSISTAAISKIPNNVKNLVIWGPKSGFSDQEVRKIDDYLQRGGHVILALNPDFNGDKFQNLRLILEKRGIYLANDLVVDKLKHINGSNGSIPMVDKFESKSPIVENFKGPIFFPLSSSVQFSRNGEIKGEFQHLAKTMTFPASWAEQDLTEVVGGKVTYTESRDIRGPITMAGTWEEKDGKHYSINKTSKITVFGNSTFVSNAYKKFSSNYTFFLNSMAWNVGDLDLISLNFPILKDEPVFISKPQLGVIFYFSVIFAPLVMVIMAIVFYRRRMVL